MFVTKDKPFWTQSISVLVLVGGSALPGKWKLAVLPELDVDMIAKWSGHVIMMDMNVLKIPSAADYV